jgi:hypothetical protein
MIEHVFFSVGVTRRTLHTPFRPRVLTGRADPVQW